MKSASRTTPSANTAAIRVMLGEARGERYLGEGCVRIDGIACVC